MTEKRNPKRPGKVYSTIPIRPDWPLTTGQIATAIKVAPRTVTRWIDCGKLKGIKLPMCRDRRVTPADLIVFCHEYGFEVPTALLSKTTLAYGLLPDELPGADCQLAESPFHFGLLAARPVGLVLLGDCDGLRNMANAARFVRQYHSASRLVMVVSESVTDDDLTWVGIDPNEVAARPLDWAKVLGAVP